MYDIYKNIEWLPLLPEELDEKLQKEELLSISEVKTISKFRLNQSQSKKVLNQYLKNSIDETKKIKILLVSEYTLDFVVPNLHVALLRSGFLPEITLLPFGDITSQLLQYTKNNSDLKFDYTFLMIDKNKLHIEDELTAESVNFLDRSISKVSSIMDLINSELDTKIVLQSFLPDSEDLFGLLENNIANTKNKVIADLNRELKKITENSNNLYFELERLVNIVGLSNWQDKRMYHLAKLPFNSAYLDLYCHKVSNLISSDKGLTKKALVLDLDNTLWGGVIGDDGLDGIKASIGDPTGESFLEFQAYCSRLKQRGIILCVCSKNTFENAVIPFNDNPDMKLKLDDFIAFKANWNNKADNIADIAKELNIGLDSIVFIDDNPLERSLVREYLPEVEVPEVPNEVSYFPEIISSAGYFESSRFSEDDIKRAKDYESNAKREILKSSATDIGEYLRSLKMQSEMSLVDESNITRPVQLMLKTNQFNFTNFRREEKEILGMLKYSNTNLLQFRLKDKFADNGIVSVVLLQKEDTVMHIDTWVMSCRVFGRTFEHYIIEKIADFAKKQDTKTLVGYYNKSEKNIIISELFEEFGFLKEEHKDYTSKWVLDLKDFKGAENYIDL